MIKSFCVSFVSESRKGRDSNYVIFDTVYVHVYEITMVTESRLVF